MPRSGSACAGRFTRCRWARSPQKKRRMDKLVIQGGVPLSGEIRVSGAKNAALPLMCAALLTSEQLTLSNVPHLRDVSTMLRLLAQMGVEVSLDDRLGLSLRAERLSDPLAPYDLVKTMRASILVLGPLLARCGEARVSLPGGCAIGTRPVDLHLKGLAALGAEISVEQGYISAKASRLKAARILIDLVTVTGTENLMMAACLAEGTTTLENAAREPEVVDLAQCLSAMGARIKGAGTDVITIEGVARLHGGQHRIMADRIETGTFLAAAAATGGQVTLHGTNAGILDAVLQKLREAGGELRTGDGTISLALRGRPKAGKGRHRGSRCRRRAQSRPDLSPRSRVRVHRGEARAARCAHQAGSLNRRRERGHAGTVPEFSEHHEK